MNQYSINKNNFFNINKKNFSFSRFLKSSGKFGKTEDFRHELVQFTKLNTVRRSLYFLGGIFIATYIYFGTTCIWEDNISAKKYQRLRTLNYILAGGCAFVSSTMSGVGFIYDKLNPAQAIVTQLHPAFKFAPIFLILSFGCLMNETNIFVSIESLMGPFAMGYILNILRLNSQNKQRKIVLIPITIFGALIFSIYIFKSYFVIRERINFKNFLYDYHSRKEHIMGQN